MRKQTILTHAMSQVGLAKLLAKTMEAKNIDSAQLCCAWGQSPPGVWEESVRDRPCRPPGGKGRRKVAPTAGGRQADASLFNGVMQAAATPRCVFLYAPWGKPGLLTMHFLPPIRSHRAL